MRIRLTFILVFTCFCLFGQQSKKVYTYKSSKSYSGPGATKLEPSSLNEESKKDNFYFKEEDFFSKNDEGKIDYDERKVENYKRDKIAKDKSERAFNPSTENGNGNRGSGGSGPIRPEMGKPKTNDVNPNIDVPDFDVEVPDVNLPKISGPNFSTSFWKSFLFILLALALIVIFYFIFKNLSLKRRKINVEVEPEDWNPELFSKSELELALEQAKTKQDYRACVRIYFTFILKELIRLRYIQWKKEKTNHDYLLQISGKKHESELFASFNIYELVWYGKYFISEEQFSSLEKHLNANYQQLCQLSE